MSLKDIAPKFAEQYCVGDKPVISYNERAYVSVIVALNNYYDEYEMIEVCEQMKKKQMRDFSSAPGGRNEIRT